MFKRTIAIPGLSLVLACIGAAGAANAQAIGYVTTFDGNISPVTSYNSSGGTNSLAILGTGLFEVTLPGLGDGLHSNVQVNAVDSRGTPGYCTIEDWFGSGTGNVVADVACFDISGNPTNELDFVLLYQARTTKPATGQQAYLWADQPTAASYIADRNYSYSSVHGLNSVFRSSAGRYTAFLGKMFRTGGNVQVTAYGDVAARCQVVGWVPDSGGTNVEVACVNATGTPTDEFFTLSYARQTTPADGAPNLFGGYAWANNPTRRNYTPPKAFQLNRITTGPLTAQRPQNAFRLPGIYTLTVPNPSGIDFTSYFGLVTAVGSAGEFCDFEEFDTFATEVDVGLACFDAQGRSLNVEYTALIALAE